MDEQLVSVEIGSGWASGDGSRVCGGGGIWLYSRHMRRVRTSLD